MHIINKKIRESQEPTVAVCIFSILAAMLISIPSVSPAGPDKCSPWPDCKKGGDNGESTGYALQFEAEAGRSGLTTDHRPFGPPPYRTCPGVPETDGIVWFVEVTPQQLDNEYVYTSTGEIILAGTNEVPGPKLSNLLIDIFNETASAPVQFDRTCPESNPVSLDGCFGSTSDNSGSMTYSIRKVGAAPNLRCESRINWDFAHCAINGGEEEFLRIQTGWMESSRDPGKGRNADCQVDKHTIDTTGSTTVELYLMQTDDGADVMIQQDVRDMGMHITVHKD